MTSRGKPHVSVTVMATLALFAATLALLVFQLRSGRDPALGPGTRLALAPAPATRHVLVRKVIVTRVIVHLPSEDGGKPTVATVPVVTTAPASSPGTVTTTPAAPVPAPAPLTTRTS